MLFKFIRVTSTYEMYAIDADNPKQAAGKLRRLSRKGLLKPMDTGIVKKGNFRPKPD